MQTGTLVAQRYRIVPSAVAQPWRSGVHVLRNVPEALEGAAEWMSRQLSAETVTPP